VHERLAEKCEGECGGGSGHCRYSTLRASVTFLQKTKELGSVCTAAGWAALIGGADWQNI
jgi:hypothetical protein